MREALRWPAILAIALLATSCGGKPPVRTQACDAAPVPAIVESTDSATRSTTLKVLTYNIEGLGFPARSGRSRQLGEIGKRLAEMREAGAGPDIVLFQEVFSRAAQRSVAATGYPSIAAGPRRKTGAIGSRTDPLPGNRRLGRGEVGLRLIGSGLAIASAYPIIWTDMRAFGPRSCAGVDCLSNKGIMLARIHVPGVPTPIDVFNTHMNSRGASRAPERRNLAAHDRQALEASEFIDLAHIDANPLIFGGDFNMRGSETRWENFSRYQDLILAHRACAAPQSGCEVKMSWDGDDPWMDTQDLQFFWPGQLVTLRPVRIEALFDDSEGSPRLSDHDGLLVTYRLSWPARARPTFQC